MEGAVCVVTCDAGSLILHSFYDNCNTGLVFLPLKEDTKELGLPFSAVFFILYAISSFGKVNYNSERYGRKKVYGSKLLNQVLFLFKSIKYKKRF